MSQRVVKDIGNYIGDYIEADANNFIGVWREYLRVRVSIPLDKPLKRRMKLRKLEENWSWVNFKYETVPTFCFIYGFMGHNEKFCHKIFDTPLETIEKKYGIFMKTEPRRRNHTIGSKWLRQSNHFPGTNSVGDTTAGLGSSGGVIGKRDKSNPLNRGGEIVTVGDNSMKGGRNFVGADIAVISGGNSKLNGQILKDHMAPNNVLNNGPYEIIDHGLHVLDAKGRRVEDNFFRWAGDTK